MLTAFQQLRRAILHALSHDVLTLAKAAAYSAILGLFPAVLVLTTVLALVPQTDTLVGEIRAALADFLPGNAIDAIQDYFNPRHARSLQADVVPGAAMSAVIWFVTTLIFGWYVTRFADYSIIYGSLGTAVATLVWLYITALSVFLGGEYNAQVAADRIAAALPVPSPEPELTLP